MYIVECKLNGKWIVGTTSHIKKTALNWAKIFKRVGHTVRLRIG